MALYNTPYNYLQITIESILNQTFNDFELIIVDDASTLEYDYFIEQFNDERIKYIKLEQNAGPGHARNVGIKEANGEYIAITDSDDVYMPPRFELQVKFLDKNHEISLLGCTFRYSNRKRLFILPTEDEDIRTYMLFNSPLNNSTIMFRKEEFEKKNLAYIEDINFGEDYELWINCMFAGVKMANLSDFLMIYTRRPGQLSKAQHAKQVAILKKLYKKMFSKIGLEASNQELNLHYDIYSETFKHIKTAEEITKWFNKIIEHNKELAMFSEESLINKRDYVLEKYKKVKQRLFKVKIGNKNYCISKFLRFYIEERD